MSAPATSNARSALRARLAAQHDVDEAGSWAISYGDMVTLLLTFFILFFSIDKAQKQHKHFKVLTDSMVERFSDMSEAGRISSSTTNLATASGSSGTIELPNVLGGKLVRQVDTLYVTFPGSSFFPSAQTSLTREGRALLTSFADKYTPFAGQYILSIRAFSDQRKVIAGKHPYKDNLELSALRAVSVLRALQEAGLPLYKMRVEGFGESREGATEASVHKNDPLARKVVLAIEPDTGEDQ